MSKNEEAPVASFGVDMGLVHFRPLLLGTLILALSPVFGALYEPKPYALLKRYPIQTNFRKFPEVVVSRDNTSNYNGLVTAITPARIQITDASFNRDMSKGVLLSPTPKTRRMIYFDRDSNILQEFSSFKVRVDNPTLTDKGDRIFFSSDRNFWEKKIYLVQFSNFANDPNYNVKIVVDQVADNDFPSVNNAGTRLAYQSLKEQGNWKVYVADLNERGTITNEWSPSEFFEQSYQPKLSGQGKHVLFYAQTPDGVEMRVADIEHRVVYPIWERAHLFTKMDLSADGEKIVFEGDEGPVSEKDKRDTMDIFVYEFKKNMIYNLTMRDSVTTFQDPDVMYSDDRNPTISEDGTVIAYEIRPRWDYSSVKVVDFRTQKTYLFSDRNENKYKPQVSKDGDTLVFLINGVLQSVNLKKLRGL